MAAGISRVPQTDRIGHGVHAAGGVTRTALGTALGAALAVAMSASGALAQQAIAESVDSRARPEYDPIGMELDDALRAVGLMPARRANAADAASSFLINANTDLELVHDDNIFRTDSDEVAGEILHFRPSVTVASDWVNHALSLTLGADIGRYLQHSSENYEDLNGAVSGRIDVDEGETIGLGANVSRGHDERGSLDDIGAPTPTKFYVYGFNASYVRDVGEIASTTTASATRSNYLDNGPTNNDDRDRWVYELRERLAHEVDDGSQVFVEGAGNMRVYDFRFDDAGQESGSHGFELLAGVLWDYSGVTFAEAAVGYIYQDYDDPALPTPKGPSFRLRTIWNATELLTLTLEGGRAIDETSQAGVSGVLKTSFAAKLDWEAAYNLILTAQAGLTNEQSRGVDREDDTTRLALRARWLIDQNWSLKSAIEHDFRETTAVGGAYTNTRLIATLTHRL